MPSLPKNNSVPRYENNGKKIVATLTENDHQDCMVEGDRSTL